MSDGFEHNTQFTADRRLTPLTDKEGRKNATHFTPCVIGGAGKLFGHLAKLNDPRQGPFAYLTMPGLTPALAGLMRPITVIVLHTPAQQAVGAIYSTQY